MSSSANPQPPAPTNSGSSADPSQGYDEELAQPPEISDSPETIDPADLKAGAQDRAKQRPLLQKILSVFQKQKTSYRELIINSEPLEKRVALLVDGVLDKFEIERESDNRMVGGIYKGRIKNLDPGLKAAFVDIGYSKNAFLHYWDMLPAAADSSIEIVRVNKKKNAPPRPADPTVKDIPGLYPPGTDIVIQVTKGPIGTKGPRTTTNLALPGRYLVLKPWQDITTKMQNERSPTCLYQEPDIVGRTVRDFLTEEVDRVLLDNQEDFVHTQELVGLISQRSKSKIAFYKDNIPIFERFNIERQIEQTFQRKVPLPSVGEIVIDETEALIAIDVNTGSHKQRSGDEKNTLFAVNMEAAIEISRQIRLRNLGGLIILDFIDMKERRHRNAIYEKMVELMSTDKARNHILPISQLGIMQMTRQRQQESLSSNLYTDCPYCRGRGIVKSGTTVSVELQRRLSSVVRRLQLRKDNREYSLRVLVHPSILERLRSEDADLLVRMEKSFGVKLAFRADPAYHVEHFKIINSESGEAYR